MRKILSISFLLLALIILVSCGNSKNSNSGKERSVIVGKDTVSANAIRVYYFHGSIRCHTCVSVDEDTHQYLKELFPMQMERGEIVFRSINVDDNERPDLVKKYQIYGQTMLFVKGDKVVNLTDKAFQYVTTNPVKWRQIVKENIFNLIN